MSIVSSHLDEIRTSIRVRPIPWDGYLRANLVSSEDVLPFKSLETLSPAQRHEAVSSKAEEYARLVVKLLGSIPREDLVKYWILFLDDAISEVPDFCHALLKLPNVWPVLSDLLDKADELHVGSVVLELSATLASKGIVPPEQMERLSKDIAAKVSDTNNKASQDVAIQALALLLQTREYRSLWYNNDSTTIGTLLSMIKENIANDGNLLPLQELYSALLVFWLASYDSSIAESFVTHEGVVGPFLIVARTSLKEKIVRLAVATLANLVRFAPKSAIPMLIAERGIFTAIQLADRKWTDDELKDDITYIKDSLQKAYDGMTTFQEYQSELEAKRLRWSPPHKNPAFWRENIDSFRKDDWTVLRQLVGLLSSSEHLTEAVACHDIAQIIDVDANAVGIVTQTGGKVRLLELIATPDSEVRFEALRATQALLSHMFS